MIEHIPVLKNEVIKFLNPKPNENFVDCTIGLGGHSLEILKRNGPQGKVLGIETDPVLYRKLRAQKIERLILVNDSFSNLEKIVKKSKFKKIAGVLYDLGISSWHLEKSGRGFSFKKKEPLIMRYNNKNGITAENILNEWPEKEIEEILRKYGQERFAKKIAENIVKERKIRNTLHLVEVVKKSVSPWYTRRKIHFATKTFLALRIMVNNELENLRNSLPQALNILENGGKILVISFHSLEDKIVKNFFREKQKEGRVKVLTKKPILPSRKEILSNNRARSAKLRVVIKI